MTPLFASITILLFLLLHDASSINITISDPRGNKKSHDVEWLTYRRYHNAAAKGIYRRLHPKDITWQGSHIEGIAFHATTNYYFDDHWSIAGKLVYALPNEASHSIHQHILNMDELNGTIAMFDRADDNDNTDGLPIFNQILMAEHLNCTAAIIADRPNQHLKRTALDAAMEGYHEHHEFWWQKVKIPAVIIGHEDAERLRRRYELLCCSCP